LFIANRFFLTSSYSPRVATNTEIESEAAVAGARAPLDIVEGHAASTNMIPTRPVVTIEKENAKIDSIDATKEVGTVTGARQGGRSDAMMVETGPRDVIAETFLTTAEADVEIVTGLAGVEAGVEEMEEAWQSKGRRAQARRPRRRSPRQI